jgi:hypothetical protein
LLIASALMAAAAFGVERLLPDLVPGSSAMAQSIRLFSAIAAGLAVLAVSAKALRIREFADALSDITARLI